VATKITHGKFLIRGY